MGSGTSKYMDSNLEHDSLSESESEFEEYVPIVQGSEKDAALRVTVSLPKAQEAVTTDKIKIFEKQLQTADIISLTYLLLDSDSESKYYFQELSLLLRGGKRSILSPWAEYHSHKHSNWQNKLIEALSIIKHYQILKFLGYNKTHVIEHFLPNNSTSIHINRLKKAVYLICENLGSNETEIFLNHIKHCFQKRHIDFSDIGNNYLEMYFLNWETEGVLDYHEIKKILKIMKEEHSLSILESVLSERSQNTGQSSNFDIPKNSLSLRHACNDQKASRNRKLSSGPSVDNNIPQARGFSNIIPHENDFMDYQHDLKQRDNNYPINSDKPGIILIINQYEFYQEVDPKYKHLLPPADLGMFQARIGTNKDRDDLERVFKKFGFTTIIENSLDHIAMIKAIQETVNLVTDESSLFICIMSHGDKGVIYGSNSCKVKVSEIQKIMASENLTNLNGKPKILILQSCQGQQCLQMDGPGGKENDDYSSITTDGPHCSHRDMLTFWATVPGYAAVRDKKYGSWFIQAFCQQLLTHADTQHFLDICTMTNDELSQKEWITDEGKNVMTPLIDNNTLRKKFYFPKIKA
nr:dredd protein [Altica viridicyanea]